MKQHILTIKGKNKTIKQQDDLARASYSKLVQRMSIMAAIYICGVEIITRQR